MCKKFALIDLIRNLAIALPLLTVYMRTHLEIKAMANNYVLNLICYCSREEVEFVDNRSATYPIYTDF